MVFLFSQYTPAAVGLGATQVLIGECVLIGESLLAAVVLVSPWRKGNRFQELLCPLLHMIVLARASVRATASVP